jgi:hypothetical protein
MLNTIPWRKRTLEAWVRGLLLQKGCTDVDAAMLGIKAAKPDTDWSRHEASCAAVTKTLLVFEIDHAINPSSVNPPIADLSGTAWASLGQKPKSRFN